MTYSPIKPDLGPSPLIDVTQIQTNFSVFGTAFASDHGAMNSSTQGDHANVIFQNQSADPGVTTDLTVLYAKNATSNVSMEPQLFVQIPVFLPTETDPTQAPNAPMQLTYNAVNTTGPQYQSFLPGGYLVYFGTTTAASPVTITLSPVPTSIVTTYATPFTMQVGGGGQLNGASTSILNQSQFKITHSFTGAFTIGWWAIAKA